MNLMNRFTLRSMKVNRKWTVVTIIGIIISTAMISGVSTFCESFMQLMRNETIASNGNWHAIISEVKKEDISELENTDFVKEASIYSNIGYAPLVGSQNRDKPYLFVRQFDEENFKNYPVNLVEGRMPQNSSELLVSQHIKDNGGVDYKLGDTVTLDIGQRTDALGQVLGQNNPFQSGGENGTQNETLTPGQSRTYTVVGIIERPPFEPTWAPGYTVISYLDTDSIGEGETVDVSLLVKNINRKIFDNVLSLAQSMGLDSSKVSFNSELLRYYGVSGNDSLQKVIYGFAGVFLAIIIIASVSLIYNAFAISISERVTQMGMLASVGATSRQKRRSVYFEGFLLGLIGIPAGIIFGIAGIGITLSAIRPLMDSFSNFTYSEGLTLHISLLSVAAAVVLAAVTIMISVWIPAVRASRIMPIDAIRQSKEVKLTRRAVKTSRLTRVLFGFEGEIALKNLKRSRKKYRATVLSLTISLVLFLTVSYYTEEIKNANSAVDSGYNFDFAVTYSGMSEDEILQANSKIRTLEEAGDISFIQPAMGIFKAEGSQLTALAKQINNPDGEVVKVALEAVFYGLDKEAFDRYAEKLGLDVAEYHNTQNPKGIIINFAQGYDNNGKKTAGKLLDLKKGDKLNFTGITTQSIYEGNAESAKLGTSQFELRAGELTDERPMGVGFPGLNNIYIVVSQEVYQSLPDEIKGKDSRGYPTNSQLYINAKSADKVNKLETQIQRITQSLTGNANVINIANMVQTQKNVMIVLGVFIYGFISLISLISIANIFNTITTNVALRRREFAMLRSVGMTPSSFNKMLRFESIFYGLKSLFYGLPISFGITLLLHNMQSDVFNIGFSLPWISYLVAVVLIFVVVGVTMLYSSAKVKKENIIDALKRD